MEKERAESIRREMEVKCQYRQSGRNCPLVNRDADFSTFCEAYKQGDGYICNAAAMEDPIEA